MNQLSEQHYLINLRRTLTTYFDESELRTLCFDLGVDYDNLPGMGKTDKARELVAYLERRNRTSDLLRIGTDLRPDIAWAVATSPINRESENILDNTTIARNNDKQSKWILLSRHFIQRIWLYKVHVGVILIIVCLITMCVVIANEFRRAMLLGSFDLRIGGDGIVVIETQKIQVDNHLGTESISKSEKITRHYVPVIELNLTTKDKSVDEQIIREFVLETIRRDYKVPEQQTCDLKMEVPPGQIREYEIKWSGYWQDGYIYDRLEDSSPQLLGTYKIIIAYECSVVKEQITH